MTCNRIQGEDEFVVRPQRVNSRGEFIYKPLGDESAATQISLVILFGWLLGRKLARAGYMKDYPFEMMMRSAKLAQISEGTNQLQQLIVAKSLT